MQGISSSRIVFGNPSSEKKFRFNQWLRTKILGLGLINFYLFVILTITGILLMFYYTPDTERAYQGIKDLEYVASSA